MCKNRSVNLFTDHSSHQSHISCHVLLGYHLLHRYTWAPVSQASEPLLRNLQGSIRLFIIPPPLCKQTPFTPSGAMVREIRFLYVCRWPLLTFPVLCEFHKESMTKEVITILLRSFAVLGNPYARAKNAWRHISNSGQGVEIFRW